MEVTLFAVIILLLFIFCFVILFGAPYLPTLKKQANVALDLLDLKEGQLLVELGSGDGVVLLYAAKRGIRGIGYELNPILVLISKIRCWRYRHLVTFYCRNYWSISIPDCDGIYTFLLDRFMSKLDKKIIQETTKPVKLVSYAFKIPRRNVVKEKAGMFLYLYR